jgi:3-deoxy-7-phosphoheptulonate synthase
MIVKTKRNATKENIDRLLEHLKKQGFQIHDSQGEAHHIYGIIGDTASFDIRSLYAFDAVKEVLRVTEPFKKVNRMMHPDDTIIDIKGVQIGGDHLTIMAGPCAVESKEQVSIIAKEVKKSGAKILRGGAYKPRTSPYSFQGMGVEGLKILREVADQEGLLVVSEIMDASLINQFEKYVDIIQIGARNMQNFYLLKALGKTKLPVMLKRGFSSTIEEWLMSAEYIMANGNEKVILCERGIRTFEPRTRNTLDISTIPLVKQLSHLPIIIDPSHAAGKWDLVESLSMGAVAAGCDGLIVEVHHDPENAFSDGAQSLKPNNFMTLMDNINKIAPIVHKKL